MIDLKPVTFEMKNKKLQLSKFAKIFNWSFLFDLDLFILSDEDNALF